MSFHRFFFRQVKPNGGDERKVKNFETRSIIVVAVDVAVVVVDVSAGTALTKRDWLVTWLTATRVKTRICWSSFSYCQFTSVTQMKGRWTNGFTSSFGFTESVQEDINENVCYLLEKIIKKWLLTIFENQKKTFFQRSASIRHPSSDLAVSGSSSDNPMIRRSDERDRTITGCGSAFRFDVVWIRSPLLRIPPTSFGLSPWTCCCDRFRGHRDKSNWPSRNGEPQS